MPIFIDRSNVNGADDYSKAPCTHVYLKVSEGTGFTDSTYRTRRAQAKQAGAHVGGYHFGSSHSSGADQADFFLGLLIAPVAGDLKPCLDYERSQDGTIMSQRQAEDFAQRVHAKLGYWPVLYGSTAIVGPLRHASAILRNCPWWRAEYGPNDGQRHPLQGGDMGAAAHQYTSVAEVPGISGRTDRSALLDARAMLIPKPKPYAVFRDGAHVKNFRSRAGVHVWMARHRQPRRGHQIQIRHRDPGGSS